MPINSRISLTEQELRNIVRDTIKEALRINETMLPTFSWDTFNSILDNQGIVAARKYCIEELGQPIGSGTARFVFEIDDHTVLKLSSSDNDIMQNLREYNTFQELKQNPLLPRIYAKSDDYVWLWCEKVLPCTHEDFERILGIPYNLRYRGDENNEEGKPDYSAYNPKRNGNPHIQQQYKDDEGDKVPLDFMSFLDWYKVFSSKEDKDSYMYLNHYGNLDQRRTRVFKKWLTHPWFQNLVQLFKYQNIDEFFDDNFGIALRNGKPTIVVLDMGNQY